MGTGIEDVTGVEKTDVEALGRRFRGQLIQPGDSSYEAARQVWNGTIDRRPALIARCAGVGDVAAALSFAETHDLVVAVRGGSHSVVVLVLGRSRAAGTGAGAATTHASLSST